MELDQLKKRLLDYLYDEMSTEERLEFEKELETNPDLKKELDEFKYIRNGLSLLEDKEVMEPFFLWGKNRAQAWNNFFSRKSLIVFKPFIAVAAILILVLLIGYLTDFTISYQKDSLFIGFNKPATQQVDYLDDTEVLNLVKAEIARNNTIIMHQIQDTEEGLDSRLASLEKKQDNQHLIHKANNIVTENELQQYYNQVQEANAVLIENFIQTSSEQQREYFQAVLTQFSDYLQEQREEDLRLIRRSLVNLKEDQDQQQQETQQILANLLNNVNTQSN